MFQDVLDDRNRAAAFIERLFWMEFFFWSQSKIHQSMHSFTHLFLLRSQEADADLQWSLSERSTLWTATSPSQINHSHLSTQTTEKRLRCTAWICLCLEHVTFSTVQSELYCYYVVQMITIFIMFHLKNTFFKTVFPSGLTWKNTAIIFI